MHRDFCLTTNQSHVLQAEAPCCILALTRAT